jgi:hypothetical protein
MPFFIFVVVAVPESLNVTISEFDFPIHPFVVIGQIG